jgi:hypothetical protein
MALRDGHLTANETEAAARSNPPSRTCTHRVPINMQVRLMIDKAQVRVLPGAPKTWATSTVERLVLEDTYQV